ncbi:MAG: hypothetical protein ACD_58C00221G0001 [uncultured bacterium]|nr:MAG: hypothetical protein ACD_58C00221G0001 [uncultured bacterium]
MDFEANLALARATIEGLKTLGNVLLRCQVSSPYSTPTGLYAGEVRVYASIFGLKNPRCNNDASNPILILNGWDEGNSTEVERRRERFVDYLKNELGKECLFEMM